MSDSPTPTPPPPLLLQTLSKPSNPPPPSDSSPVSPSGHLSAGGHLSPLTPPTTAPGKPDLQVSETARQMYIDVITTFRNVLIEQRNKVAELVDYGHKCNVGTLPSANAIKASFIDDTYSAAEALDQSISYLHDHERAVNAVFRLMHAEDMSGTGWSSTSDANLA